MASWVGAQGQVNLAKKAKTSSRYDVTHRKAKTKKKFKSKLEDFPNIGFEQLSSSTGW